MSINSNLVDVMKKEYEFELHYGKLWVTLRQTMGYITTNYGLHYDKLWVTLRQTGAHITSKHQSITPYYSGLWMSARRNFSKISEGN